MGRLPLRAEMGLRILHTVEYYAPSVGGAQVVVQQISERLAAQGHEVTVATSSDAGRQPGVLNGVEVVEFDISGNLVRGLRGDVEAYRRFVLENRFDVVMMYAAQQWTTDALLDELEGMRGMTVLAPCGFSGLQDPAYTGYFETLRERLPHFDAVIVHSEGYQDAEFVRNAGAKRVTLIPNAADEREFTAIRASRSEQPAGDPLLLSVGGHTGLKGHAQAMAAFRHADRTRGGTLAILGNEPHGPGCLKLCRARAAYTRVIGNGRRVVLANPIRERVVEMYESADLFLFCSMVECSPLVLFECMAAGLPFVSLDVGNAAEIAEWGGCGLVVESRRRADGLVEADRAAIAGAVDDLLVDPERRREMGARGRIAWEQRFTWDTVARQYGDLYASVAP